MRRDPTCAAAFGLMVLAMSQAASQDRGMLPVPRPAFEAGPIKPLYSKSYALVIGIDAYTNGWTPLAKAVEDAETVADALKAQGFDVQLVTSAQVDVRTGRKKVLNREQLEASIEEFFQAFADDDQARAVVWFAGHGASVKVGSNALGYLIGADAPNPRSATNAAQRRLVEQQMQRRSVFMESVETYVRQSNAKHVLLVFDSCFAGTIFQNRPRAEEVPRSIVESAKAPLRFAITSGSADQTVPDDGNFRSVFLRALAADSPADTDRNGFVTGTELDSYLRLTLMDVQKRRETPQSGHLRLSGTDRGDFIFQVRPDAVVETGALVAGATELHSRFWSFVRDENSPGLIDRYVTRFPDTPHRDDAVKTAAVLTSPAVEISGPRVSAQPNVQPSELRVLIGTNRGPEALTEGDPRDVKGRTPNVLPPTAAPNSGPNTSGGGRLLTGFATVNVPRGRAPGAATSPTKVDLLVGSFSLRHQDLSRHFFIRERARVPEGPPTQDLIASLGGPESRDALVYVHGYNTSTSDAVLKAAQIATDIGFTGVTAAFVWPSSQSATAYVRDRDQANAATFALLEFLELLARDARINRIHLAAQGMGNVPVFEMLRGSRQVDKLSEIVAVAPDLSPDLFDSVCELANRSVKSVRGITAYLAQGDTDLAVSRRIQAAPRAGELVADVPVIGPCADRIDVSHARANQPSATDMLSDPVVLADLAKLVATGLRPPARRSMTAARVVSPKDQSEYWRLIKP